MDTKEFKSSSRGWWNRNVGGMFNNASDDNVNASNSDNHVSNVYDINSPDEHAEDGVSGMGGGVSGVRSGSIRSISSTSERDTEASSDSLSGNSEIDSDSSMPQLSSESNSSQDGDSDGYDQPDFQVSQSTYHTVYNHQIGANRMSPAMLAVILQSLPALIQLVQNMITDLKSGNGNVTEEQVITMQQQVDSLVNMANEELTNTIASVQATAPSGA